MSRNRLALAALVSSAAMAISPAMASAKPTIVLSGSTTVAPLASLLIPSFLSTHKNAASFRLFQGGSDIGVADAAAGRSTIGNSSRDAKSTDPGGLVWYKIARDAICVVTNSGNTVSNLTQDQVKAIFSGSTRNWQDVPGSNKTGPIALVVRTAASGTQDAFQKLIMGSAVVSATAAQKSSNGLIQSTVKSNPNAIGYVSYDFVTGLHDVNYTGVPCTLTNAKSGSYPAVRNLWMITRGSATGVTKTFIDWVQNNPAAATIVAKHWVPLS